MAEMKKFRDLPYQRVVYEEVEKEYRALMDEFKAAKSGEEQFEVHKKYYALSNRTATMMTIAQIRFDINTEDEFYGKYASPVSVENRYAADDFISLMEELEASAQNEDLKAELRYLAEEMELAKGHEMEHVNNVYKKLHDLDYFLLRYGPEVFDSYKSDYDTSTVCKYYGTLSFYA